MNENTDERTQNILTKDTDGRNRNTLKTNI